MTILKYQVDDKGNITGDEQVLDAIWQLALLQAKKITVSTDEETITVTRNPDGTVTATKGDLVSETDLGDLQEPH